MGWYHLRVLIASVSQFLSAHFLPIAQMNDSPSKIPSDPQTRPADETASLEIPTASVQPDLDQLTQHLENYLLAWEEHPAGPPIAEHLPTSPPVLRHQVLCELIKADIELRLEAQQTVKSLESYAVDFPELCPNGEMPRELIYEEYHLRKANGDPVNPKEYLERFPSQAQSLENMMLGETPEADQTEVPSTFESGDRIGDFYLMVKLGAGAFGSVYLAQQETMHRLVALKISADKGNEAQTLAQLDHPNIVRVYDQIRMKEQNLRLIYMQFAAGGTLQSVIKELKNTHSPEGELLKQCITQALQKTGVLTDQSITLKNDLAEKPWPVVVCHVGMELANALAYAHSRGVLHRDVKPANVLLDANGTAKLADFNISFSSDLQGSNPTAYFGGSLAYMSPEQLQACHYKHEMSPADLDGRADVYSLAVMLWELLEGSRPFADVSGNDFTSTLDVLITQRLEGIRQLEDEQDSEIHQQLKALLRRCLSSDRKDRPANALQFAQELCLCQQVSVANVLQKSDRGWAKLSQWYPRIAFLIAAIGPHALAAIFNHYYNDQAIINELSDAKEAFFKLVLIINAIAFPIGFGFCLWFVEPVAKTLKQHSNLLSEEQLSASKKRTLRLSPFVTILGLTEWIIAGLIYPIGLHLITGGLELKWHIHFFGSLLICGLLAAAYPFLLTAALSIRSLLPKQLKQSALTRSDIQQLSKLDAQLTWTLYLAGGVPAVAMMILLFTQEAADPHSAFTLKILSLLGAVGFAFVLGLVRALQREIEGFRESFRLIRQLKNH